MTISIEDLGMSKDTLIALVVGNIADRLSDDIEASIAAHIKDTFSERIKKNVDAISQELCKETFESVFQPIDCYGQIKGKPTTVMEMLKESCINFWNDQVDHYGNKVDRPYKEKRRYQYICETIVKEIIHGEVKEQSKAIFEEIKSEVQKATIAALSQSITEKL